jgi:hypothetical protein
MPFWRRFISQLCTAVYQINTSGHQAQLKGPGSPLEADSINVDSPSLENKFPRACGMARVVEHEALSSNPNTTTKKNKLPLASRPLCRLTLVIPF